MKEKHVLLNCYKCGKFVGENGYDDVSYDDYMGGHEVGYPTCAKHTKGLTNKQIKEMRNKNNQDIED